MLRSLVGSEMCIRDRIKKDDSTENNVVPPDKALMTSLEGCGCVESGLTRGSGRGVGDWIDFGLGCIVGEKTAVANNNHREI